MQISYPQVTNEQRTLLGIFTIENTDRDYDTIYLGDIEIGYATQDSDGKFVFIPTTEVENPFPQRESYAELWQDIVTLIANDLDLAIEFTIKAQHKNGDK